MSGDEAIRYFPSLAAAIRKAYAEGQEDERLEPVVVVDENGLPKGRFRRGDSVIFYDIRGEREIELTSALIDRDFDFFSVEKDLELDFVTMVEYHRDLDVRVAFPPLGEITDTLSHILSENGLKQVKIVESEKAVHLSYFFNGKSDSIIPNEERIIIPSDKVEAPEDNPEMNVSQVADAIKERLAHGETNVIVANLANVDVVGHTERESAILTAVAAVDRALGDIIETAMENGVTSLVSADHGTVESWLYPDGTVDTGHTTSPVPFVLVEPDESIASGVEVRKMGELSDVAPTILDILGLDTPAVMTGSSLLVNDIYKHHPKKRLLLLILDGWGVGAEGDGNLISKARTPAMDGILDNNPGATLQASGEAVGMPKGSVGNSEVGHLHLGSGRRIPSDRTRIDGAIDDGSFYENPAFQEAMRTAQSTKKSLHLLGIVSFYSSHGSIAHLYALLEMAKSLGVENVYIHGFLGRRGEHAQSGARYTGDIEEFTKKLNLGQMVTVIGRHWALDREHNWDRVKKTYDCLVRGHGMRVCLDSEGR